MGEYSQRTSESLEPHLVFCYSMTVRGGDEVGGCGDGVRGWGVWRGGESLSCENHPGQ